MVGNNKTKKRTTNKTQKVLEHLQKHGSITSFEAIDLYGATRLSAIIYNLRKIYTIESINSERTDRYGNIAKYSTYVLRA
ncbi:MAG: DNA-binding protein [Alphaproteobacteria bacterium]|nr:DNA-binding protein [Alphaproteobacteria bacterium]